MKKLIKKVILPVALLAGLGSFGLATDPTWQIVGEFGSSQYGVSGLDIGIDSNDVPYVAYSTYWVSVGVTVKEHNGTDWVLVGDLGFSEAKDLRYLTMDFDSKDIPYIGFMEWDSTNGYYGANAMKYNSSTDTWVILEERNFTGTGVFAPSTAYTTIAIKNDDVPLMVYTGYDRLNAPHGRANAWKYSPTSDRWDSMGHNFTEDGTKEITLAISGENIPYVAYVENASGDKASVMKYDRIDYSPLHWFNVGAARFSAGAVEYISIALNSTSTPYVAYKDKANGGKATVMKYYDHNNTWGSVGQAGFTSGAAEFVSLAIDGSDTLYVAYNTSTNSGGINVMKYDGSSWVSVGAENFVNGTMQRTTALAIDSKGVPYIAFKNLGTGAVKATVMYAPSITCKRKDQITGDCIPGVEDPGWTDPYPEVPFDGNYGQGDGTEEGNRPADPGWTDPYPEIPCGGTPLEQGSDECAP